MKRLRILPPSLPETTPPAGTGGRVVGRIGYPYTVLYDGDCHVCTRLVSILSGWDVHGMLEVTPAQTPGVHARFPWIPPQAYLDSVQFVRNSDGTTWQGAAAVEAIIDVMPKGRWVGWVFAIPLVRPLAERAYRWFARRRYQLGCTEHCRPTPQAVDTPRYQANPSPEGARPPTENRPTADSRGCVRTVSCTLVGRSQPGGAMTGTDKSPSTAPSSGRLDALLSDPAAGAGITTPAPVPVLLAVTDDDLAATTAQVTRVLAERRGAVPTLSYVIEVNLYASPDTLSGAMMLTEELLDPAILKQPSNELRATLHLDTGPAAAWPCEIDVGAPASSIAQRARTIGTSGAQLIVMGLHHHHPVGRLIGNDTAQDVMRLSDVPVLAIRPELTGLPERVVVAVDFSRASIRAARLARWLLADRGAMHLLFVEPPIWDGTTESMEGMRVIQSTGVAAAFDELIADLAPSEGMTIAPVTCKGNPIAEMKRLCEQVHPDLFAIGRQRHPLIERVLLGSVAAAMVRDARWSVLVTPPAPSSAPSSTPSP